MKKWSEVQGSPGFQALKPERREEVRNKYFEHAVKPNIPEARHSLVREKFDNDTAPSPTVWDYLALAGQGGASLVEGAGYVADQMGIPYAGDVQSTGKRGREYWQESLSPRMKQQMAKPFISEKEGEFFGPGWNAPKIAGTVAQSALPSMIGMGAGGLAAKGLMNVGLPAAGAGIVGGAIGEGGISGTMSAVDVFNLVQDMDHKTLSQSEAYRKALARIGKEVPEETRQAQAREQMAHAAASDAGIVSAISTAILGAPSGAALGRILGGETGKSLLRTMGKQAVLEGLVQEAPQSAVEQLAANWAVQKHANPSINLLEDVGEAAVGGGVAGGVMGFGMGGIAHKDAKDMGLPTHPGSQKNQPPATSQPSGYDALQEKPAQQHLGIGATSAEGLHSAKAPPLGSPLDRSKEPLMGVPIVPPDLEAMPIEGALEENPQLSTPTMEEVLLELGISPDTVHTILAQAEREQQQDSEASQPSRPENQEMGILSEPNPYQPIVSSEIQTEPAPLGAVFDSDSKSSTPSTSDQESGSVEKQADVPSDLSTTDGSVQGTFIPTHETSDGEPVVWQEDGTYLTEDGVTVEDDYATPIDASVAKHVDKPPSPIVTNETPIDRTQNIKKAEVGTDVPQQEVAKPMVPPEPPKTKTTNAAPLGAVSVSASELPAPTYTIEEVPKRNAILVKGDPKEILARIQASGVKLAPGSDLPSFPKPSTAPGNTYDEKVIGVTFEEVIQKRLDPTQETPGKGSIKLGKAIREKDADTLLEWLGRAKGQNEQSKKAFKDITSVDLGPSATSATKAIHNWLGFTQADIDARAKAKAAQRKAEDDAIARKVNIDNAKKDQVQVDGGSIVSSKEFIDDAISKGHTVLSKKGLRFFLHKPGYEGKGLGYRLDSIQRKYAQIALQEKEQDPPAPADLDKKATPNRLKDGVAKDEFATLGSLDASLFLRANALGLTPTEAARVKANVEENSEGQYNRDELIRAAEAYKSSKTPQPIQGNKTLTQDDKAKQAGSIREKFRERIQRVGVADAPNSDTFSVFQGKDKKFRINRRYNALGGIVKAQKGEYDTIQEAQHEAELMAFPQTTPATSDLPRPEGDNREQVRTDGKKTLADTPARGLRGTRKGTGPESVLHGDRGTGRRDEGDDHSADPGEEPQEQRLGGKRSRGDNLEGDSVPTPASRRGGNERGGNERGGNERGGDRRGGDGRGTDGNVDGRPPGHGSRQVTTGSDYQITQTDSIGSGGAKQKARDNLVAIRTLKTIESENRPATPDEQAALVRFVGWGGLINMFPNRDQFRPEWQSLGEELQELLTKEEYAAARASTPNAHYTSPEVVQSMWSLAESLGFKGGTLLEPGMGSGLFFGLMPKKLAANSQKFGVELDHITGRIAKALYPSADIRIEGYQEAKFPENSFDLAVGNVPFADVVPNDSKYNRKKFPLHDYYFAKTIEMVKPGGLVMFITSRYTMDKQAVKLRAHLGTKADLVGAIRLPNTAFKGIANTEVTTDIIVLQKRDQGVAKGGPAWSKVREVQTPDGGVKINEYFADHPERMAGTMRLTGSMYRDNEPTLVANSDRPLAEQLSKINADIVANSIPTTIKASSATNGLVSLANSVPSPEAVKEGAFYLKDGKLYRKEDGVGHLVGVRKKGYKDGLSAIDQERVGRLVVIRDAARQVLETQIKDEPESAQHSARKRLNSLYDAFVNKHGPINQTNITIIIRKDGVEVKQRRMPNFKAFSPDPDAHLVAALEEYDEESGIVSKAAIFHERVLKPSREVKSVENAHDGLAVSLNQKGHVDLAYIADLTGKSKEQVISSLRGDVFQEPDTGDWVTADAYLSGNVRKKLDTAIQKAKSDRAWQANVDALKKVQPEDLLPSKISARLGAPWIPTSDIETFLKDFLGDHYIQVSYSPLLATWDVDADARISHGIRSTNDWGTKRLNAIDLVKLSLNLKKAEVRDSVMVDGVDKLVVNTNETLAAQDKQQKLKDRFEKWIWEDASRGERLARMRIPMKVPTHSDPSANPLPWNVIIRSESILSPLSDSFFNT